PAIKLLTPTQTPEPITHVGQSRCSPSRETAAHERLKSPLTISEMRSIDQNDVKAALLQDPVDRDPVDAGGFHRNPSHAGFHEPGRQIMQV
ncbi:hypothetical protein, partial [Bradyrhizobium sp. 150]|uniref:hypothetical protein n=1 Tax=Bradyrhizobium sp. 150 TaxID=2782625 RepID=UPI001FF8BFFA